MRETGGDTMKIHRKYWIGTNVIIKRILKSRGSTIENGGKITLMPCVNSRDVGECISVHMKPM